jgi:hypothetical protein
LLPALLVLRMLPPLGGDRSGDGVKQGRGSREGDGGTPRRTEPATSGVRLPTDPAAYVDACVEADRGGSSSFVKSVNGISVRGAAIGGGTR